MSDPDDPFLLTLSSKVGRPIMSVMLKPLPAGAQIISIDANLVYRHDESIAAMPWAVRSLKIMPWHDIEEIAAYVAGDGSDAARVALADGIREGRR